MCRALAIPFAMVRSTAEVRACPQLRARGFWVTVDREHTGPLAYPGAPWRFSRTPWRIRRPAPTLGQHNAEVFEKGTLTPGLSRPCEQSVPRPHVVAQRSVLARMVAVFDDPAAADHHVAGAVRAVVAEDPGSKCGRRSVRRGVGSAGIQHQQVGALANRETRDVAGAGAGPAGYGAQI